VPYSTVQHSTYIDNLNGPLLLAPQLEIGCQQNKDIQHAGMIAYPHSWLRGVGIDVWDAIDVTKGNEAHQPSSTPLSRPECHFFRLDPIDELEGAQEALWVQRQWECHAHGENERHHAVL
jgi:hypothetical protein